MAHSFTVLGSASPACRATSRRRRFPVAFCAGALALALLCLRPSRSFTSGVPAAGAARGTAVARQASGFSDAAQEKAVAKKGKDKKVLTPEDLQALHGDKWKLVDAVFKGNRAESPEAIMRARFTALYFKDPGFLAATELDDLVNIRQRVDNWKVTLGLKEKNFLDSLRLFGEEIENLKEADSFEVIEATDTEVEFKIRCRNGKVLHERSTFKEDKKYGYVFSGESAFGKWE